LFDTLFSAKHFFEVPSHGRPNLQIGWSPDAGDGECVGQETGCSETVQFALKVGG
jgi:hypothetical protein